MKKSKILLAVFMGFLALAMVSSCNKDELKNNEVLAEKRSLDVSRISTMQTVINGILKFNSNQHLSQYLDEINEFEPKEIDELETILNFTSLRKLYNQQESTNPNWRENHQFIIENPFDALTFNNHHEIWVGNDIYKFVDKNLIAKTTSGFVNEIVSMRSNGLDRPNVVLVDRIQKTELPETASPRSTCTMSITMPFNPTGTNDPAKITGYMKPVIIDQDGDKPTICGGSLVINWGDGQIENIANGNITDARSHRYTVGPGECKTFKVKVTATLKLCGICTSSGDMTLVTESNMTFCNPISCTPHEHETGEKLVLDQVYGGASNNDFRVFFIMGYDADDYLWHNARAWGHIKHFQKELHGSGLTIYIPSPVKVKSRIFIHGAVFEESCLGNRIAVSKNSNLNSSYKCNFG